MGWPVPLQAFVVVLQPGEIPPLPAKGQGPKEIQIMQFNRVLGQKSYLHSKDVIFEAFLSEFQLEI